MFRLASTLAILLWAGASNAMAEGVVLGQTKPTHATAMRIYGSVTAPQGFRDFCHRTPDLCVADGQGRVRIVLNPQHWSELVQVNGIVNATVIARSDLEVYGANDYWTLAGMYGDCEDYALTKQNMLGQRGWPRGALLMTVVRDETGQGHAVLTVRTTSGDFILDNRQDRILPWTQVPYEFVKRQSMLDPQVWMAIEPSIAPAAERQVSTSGAAK